MTTRRGRGRAAATITLIEAMLKVAAEIQPCPVRALAYQLSAASRAQGQIVWRTNRPIRQPTSVSIPSAVRGGDA